MKNRKLTSIRWRMLQGFIWSGILLSVLTLFILLVYYHLDFQVLFSVKWLGLPFVIILEVLIVAVSALFGYVFGSGVKKRLELLSESILNYERGNFGHRVPSLGEDEIGLMAQQLNEMAQRVEKQVASLQRLSTEKAELNEQVKKSAISEERQRLARELHDAVSQQLFAISMMTSAILENPELIEGTLKKRIVSVEKMAGNAQNEMRALLLHLRPATLEGKGLKEGLEELLSEFETKQPLVIHWEIADLPELTKGIEDHLFRIVQESMSNVFRHSQAASVSIRLGTAGGQLHLRIIDNGTGFNMTQSKPSSYGLQSIQERANEIGGVAEIISFPEKGTQVEVKVPIMEKRREKES
ncbi:MAG TPA: sensor histidine kinase [Bacillales bacterium]|nr:sensor histidine kinase [Bacillales bacterium]